MVIVSARICYRDNLGTESNKWYKYNKNDLRLGSVQRYLNPKIKCSKKYLLSNDTRTQVTFLESPHWDLSKSNATKQLRNANKSCWN